MKKFKNASKGRLGHAGLLKSVVDRIDRPIYLVVEKLVVYNSPVVTNHAPSVVIESHTDTKTNL